MSAFLSKISNVLQNLSRKKLNKGNRKRSATLFLLHVCRKNIDNLQCTRFCVIHVKYRVQYFEPKGLDIKLWLKSN